MRMSPDGQHSPLGAHGAIEYQNSELWAWPLTD
jgi:hypothetical protein